MVTVKAQRAQIDLFGNLMEVYRLNTDNSYWISKIQISAKIGKLDNSVDELLSFLPMSSITVDVDGELIEVVPLKFASTYWTYWASNGNDKAMDILVKSTIDCLQHRGYR
jgi:hypothetical protein